MLWTFKVIWEKSSRVVLHISPALGHDTHLALFGPR